MINKETNIWKIANKKIRVDGKKLFYYSKLFAYD